MRRYLTLALVSILLVIGQTSSSAEAAGGTIDSLLLQATLQTSGNIGVSQQLKLGAKSQLSWEVFSNIKGLTVRADGVELAKNKISLRKKSNGLLISSNVTARDWEINYTTTSTLIRHNDRDQFFFKVLDTPGVTINQVTAQFNLGQSVDPQLFVGNVYAIGGIIGARSSTVSGKIITYTADLVGPNALMTLNASWPKSVLNLSRNQEIRLALSNLDGLPWLVLGASLPLAALIILVVLIVRQRRQDRVTIDPTVNRPPADLSPMVVGVLVNKKIYPEEVVALLVDFCRRGYLLIIKKDAKYYFGQRRLPDQHLQPWEKNILEQVVPNLGVKISTEEISEINKQTLFSPPIRSAFNEIYEVITQHQYFVENPHITRIRYKLVALGFYFASVVGLIWTAATNSTPYLLIPLVGTIILSWLIIKLTAQLTHYTPNGLRQRSAWLSYGQFLGSADPIDPTMARNQTFENYLPYAIVLGKTAEWGQRFDRSSATIIQPDWFISFKELNAGQLADELVEFISQVSKLLTSLRGPLVN